jgi:cyclohexanone monooxygenase
MAATVDAVVVGAGFGGIYMVHKLREMGFSVQGFEKGADVGGTWYWNRYPGARCDVGSLFYSYTFSDELRAEWRWTEMFSAQPEILAYANHVADRFDIRRSYRFDTVVVSEVFDPETDLWTITTDQGEVITARYCIMATGCLSMPKDPEIDGAESFKGPIYHTGRWPHEGVDFTGKRVAVIGTGSSGIQSIPEIAKAAAQVYVFQRTANYTLPSRNRPIDDAMWNEFMAAYPEYKKGLRDGTRRFAVGPVPKTREEETAMFEATWARAASIFMGWHPNLVRDQAVNDRAAAFYRDKVATVVDDPETAEDLSPKGYPMGTKRMCADTGYFKTFNRDNVRLINLRKTPLDRITPAGVKTSAEDFQVDAIVFATGYDAMTGALLAVDIRGKDGQSLRDVWADGPKAYLGLSVAGFPNLFAITGPGSPSVLSNVIASCEQHVEWIAECMDHMRAKGLTRIEADEQAQDDWVAHVAEVASHTLYPKAASWYMGANVPGKPRVFMPYIGGDYRPRCQAVVDAGYQGFALSGARVTEPAY